MNLERFIVALGPGEVVNGAPAGAASVEISDLAYDTRAVTPGALFFCVRGRNVDGHAFAATAATLGRGCARGRASRRGRRCRSSWSATRGRRCRSPRRSSSATPLRELARRGDHRNEREDDLGVPAALDLRGRGPADGAADEHRAARRRRAARRPASTRPRRSTSSACSGRWPTAVTRSACSRRPPRPARKDGSKARGSPC